MANRSMASKILKAKKEASKEMIESANNFSCTRFFRDTARSRYTAGFWLKGVKGTAK